MIHRLLHFDQIHEDVYSLLFPKKDHIRLWPGTDNTQHRLVVILCGPQFSSPAKLWYIIHKVLQWLSY